MKTNTVILILRMNNIMFAIRQSMCSMHVMGFTADHSQTRRETEENQGGPYQLLLHRIMMLVIRQCAAWESITNKTIPGTR